MALDHLSFCCISFRALHLQSITAHHTQADTGHMQTFVTTKTWLWNTWSYTFFITDLLALFPQRCTPSMKLSVRPYSGLITFEDVILGNTKPATSSVTSERHHAQAKVSPEVNDAECSPCCACPKTRTCTCVTLHECSYRLIFVLITITGCKWPNVNQSQDYLLQEHFSKYKPALLKYLLFFNTLSWLLFNRGRNARMPMSRALGTR